MTTEAEHDFDAEDVPITRGGMKDIWIDFLQRHRKTKQDEILNKMGKTTEYHGYYFNLINDMWAAGSKTLIVDYFDILETLDSGLADTEKFILIRNQVDRFPGIAAEVAKDAVYDILHGGLNRDYAKAVRNELAVVFKNNGQAIEIPDLAVDLVGKLVMVEGIVSEMDYRRRPRVLQAVYKCAEGHPIITSGKAPRKCVLKECESQKFVFSNEDSQMQNMIEFGIQQRPDRAVPGKNDDPLNLMVVGEEMSGYVIHSVMPGDFVSITGIVRVTEITRSDDGVASTGEFFIEAQAITVKRDEYMLVEDDEITAEEVKHFVNPETEEQGLEKLIRSICPSVRGHRLPKLALLLLAASSEPQKAADGTRHRGALNMLWVGAKDTGKTTVALYAQQIIERVFYNSGIGSSRAGLTASIDVSKRDAPNRLKPGAFMMAANGGAVIIDEAQDLSKDDVAALLEMLDDKQTMTIRKAGMHLNPFSLNSACLMICNPITSDQRIDPGKNIAQNTGLRVSLISRMDAIFPFIDKADAKEDELNAQHHFSTYDTMISEKEYDKNRTEYRQSRVMGLMDSATSTIADIYTPNQIAHYIRHVRRDCHPKLRNGSAAAKRLTNWYLAIRQAHKLDYLEQSNEEFEGTTQEERDALVGMRILGAGTRWAEASARCCGRNEVTDADAKRAITIMEPMIAWAEAANRAYYEEQKQKGGKSKAGYDIDVMKLADKQRLDWAKRVAQTKRQFDIALRVLAWTPCTACHGQGMIRVPSTDEDSQEDDLPEDLICRECNGRGGWNTREGFVKSDLQANMMNRWQVPYKQSEAIFNEYVHKGYLEQISSTSWRVVGDTPGVLAKPAKSSGSLNYSPMTDKMVAQDKPVSEMSKLDEDFAEIDREASGEGEVGETSVEEAFE